MPTRRLLLLGDVCSGAGRDALAEALPGLRRWTRADLVVANVENAAGGYGINARIAQEILDAGVDVLTTGDHAFDRKDAWRCFDDIPRLLRPLNFPAGAPGRGSVLVELDGFNVGVVNLVGRVFMKPLDCPFDKVLAAVEELRHRTRVILVDFHAEATAEKQAMGWFLDGRVSALLGTHTHVQTADETVLPGGTAYLSDVGMCGAFDSVLGMSKDDSLQRLLRGLPYRLHPALGDPRVSGALVEVDDETGRALAIERVQVHASPPETPAEPNQNGEPEVE
jgi:metallophosphoesterase (TIGR00282 family)